MTESVQWAVAVPVLLGVLLASLQIALTWHARNVAASAAAAAAEAQSVLGAAPGEGERAARSVLAVGGLDAADVRVQDDGRIVRVRVTGRATVLVSVADRIERSVVVAKERAR